ncbi:MAG TPA: TOBE domain-containing protein [Accumulibacter sp.]|nr:TOBE domain-containing protein [Accumulibacter sp.]HRD94478.1 TOBE domain-containing protein [Accumulibacter sp.]HRF72412.1 TOBE domain-containing protein [Accumulibacter sp.]
MVDVAGEPLLARITRRSADKLGIGPALALQAQIKAVALLA